MLKCKIIMLSENELNDDKIKNFESKIKIHPEPSESKNENGYIPNYYIKYQDNYSIRNIWKEK